MKESDPAVYRRKCFLINLAYFLTIGALVLVILRYALSSLVPFVIALVVAALLRPVLRFLNEKLKMPKAFTGILLTLTFYLLVLVLGIVVMDRLLDVVRAFLMSIPSLWSGTLLPILRSSGEEVSMMLAEFDIGTDFISLNEILNHLGTNITSLSTKLLSAVGNIAFSLPSLLISVIICIISTLFMLFDWDKIRDFIYLQFSSKNGELANKALKQGGSTIRQYIVSYGLILIISFTELSLGFLIIGFKNPFILAALIAVFDILPVVGCGGVLIPWGIICLIIGNARAGFGLLILYAVITVVRNIVEPKIISDQVGLHPLVTIMSMVVGSSLMGGVGLFGLPITLAVLNKMNKDGVIHLFKRREENT